MTVLDFNTAKFIRDHEHLVKVRDLSIDWKDVTRYTYGDALTPSDRIELAEPTRQKVADIFQSFGLPPTPGTWGQLARNLGYCEQLVALTMGAPYGQSMESIMRGGETWKKGWGVRLKALVEGDLETLARLHQEADIFRLNGLREDDKPATAV
ncbi:Uncharacterised protein [Burkholderia pseudomallei]|nr:Uncharacterised protein [Burkholderia pseudomallei]